MKIGDKKITHHTSQVKNKPHINQNKEEKATGKKGPEIKDTSHISQDAKKEEKDENKGIFNWAYNWITGESEDSSKDINQEKLKDFEKKTKEKPGKYKHFRETQEKSDGIVKEEKNKSINSLLLVETSPSGLDGDKVKEYEEKLKIKNPEEYKKYKELQEKDGKLIDKTLSEAKETLSDGVKKSDHYFNSETILNYGISGIDSYEADKGNKEAEIKEDKIKNKDHEKYKNLMKNKFSADMEITKSDIERADGIQTIVDTVDITLGGAEKLVDFRNSISGGNYKGAAWDLGEAGLRIGVSALLESGKAFDWAGKAGLKALKTAGPGAKKLFNKGDELLKTIAPEVYNTIKSSSGMAKKAVTEALDEGCVMVNKTLKELSGKDIVEIWEMIGEKPVKELISDVKDVFKAGKEPLKDVSHFNVLDDGLKINAPVKTYGQIINDVKDFYAKNNLKPIKLKFPRCDVNFYGEKCEAQLIEEAIKKLPKTFTEKIANFKDIYVDDFLFKHGQDIKKIGGLCDGENIILNRATLTPNHALKSSQLFYEAEFSVFKDRWNNIFNHELFHAVDRTLGNSKGVKYLSDTIKEFSEPGARKITKYAEKCQLNYETAAETFMKLMEEKRIFVKENKIFNERDFLDKIFNKNYGKEFEVIINNYLLNNKSQIIW